MTGKAWARIEPPLPPITTSLVLRVDFTEDAEWDVLKAALIAEDLHTATFVSDPQYDGVSIQDLVQADAGAADNDKLTYVFLADTTTMADEEHPLLAVDLYDQPGRTFRTPPRWYADISANLSIANMNFAEFADRADTSGTFRGFDQT
ncbi:DUF6924 domain-containing protein [Micromonospora sp. NPDC003197]